MRDVVAATLLAASMLSAADTPDYFGSKLYPVLESAQCRLCHNDNGVASTTRLQFPPETATAEDVTRFGVSLARFVDPAQPDLSLLFRKPTNRLQHTGGERIKQGSPEESVLREWVAFLSRQPESARAASSRATTGKLAVTIRRLTHSQYNHTVADLLGDQTRPADQFPKEDFIHGFTNQAEGQSISPLQAEAYNRAAERLARNAFRGGDGRGLVPCKPSAPGDTACATQFVRTFGRRAFRRPLAEDEARRYVRILTAEAQGASDFYRGAQLVVEVMLQSPHFLFHLGEGAGANARSWRNASRLSYFLWDSMPDEHLFELAESGKLETREQIRSTVLSMLSDPRARAAMGEFLAEWLRFDRLRNAIRDRRLYPDFGPELVANMIDETRRLFDSLVWEDRNFLEFLTADYSFVSSTLARLYGLPSPSEEFGLVALPVVTGRAGFLGQASFLTLTSKPADTSPTERGLFIREHLLCQNVPPPPPGVDTTLPTLTDEKPMNTRERLGVHLSNPACAACHRLVDPIGFGLERYDAIGRYREKETVTIHPTADEIKRRSKTKPTSYELPIVAGGFIQGLQDATFNSPRELGTLLAKEPACQRCIVKQLFRYATGRTETAQDQPILDAALTDFRASRFRFRELIIAIATSPSFLGGAE